MLPKFKYFLGFSLALIISLNISCTQNEAQIGSKKRPIQFLLVPAQDTQAITDNGKPLKAWLEKDTGLSFELQVPTNYVAVVEAFGTKRADMAIINTFGYILAHDRYGVEARLLLINRGREEYNGQIISRKDGPVQSIKDINGKKFAFVDPASTSGYLLAADLFEKEKVKPKEVIFASRHDTVVTAVYNKQVDAGATFYTPPDEEGPKDARWIVKTQFPDVFEKVQILKLTGPIPNDPVAFRKDFPPELREKIAKSLQKFIQTPEGKGAMMGMYHITDLKDADDHKYDSIRLLLKNLGKSAQDLVK